MGHIGITLSIMPWFCCITVVLVVNAVQDTTALLPETRPTVKIIQPSEPSSLFRANDDAEIHCQLFNFPPGSSIKWFFSSAKNPQENEEIATSTVSHNEQKYDIEAIDTVSSTWMLQVRLLQPEDSGFYQCAAQFNLSASTISRIDQSAFVDSVEILVTEPVQVIALEYNVFTYLRQTANMSWTITGRPLPKLTDIHITRVRGLVDRQTLLSDDRHLVRWNKTDSRTIHVTLTIIQVTKVDAGTYVLFAGRGPLGSPAAHASVSLESLEEPAETLSPEMTSDATNVVELITNHTTTQNTEKETSGDGSKVPQDNGSSIMTEQQMVYIIAGVLAGLTALGIFIGLMCLWHRRSQKKHDEATYMRHMHENMRHSAPGPNGHVNRGYDDMQSYSNYSMPFESNSNYSYATLEADKYDFPRSRLRFLDELGSGKFGQILLAEALNILGNSKWTTVAVKMAKDSATDYEKEDVRNELDIMRAIPRHANVITLLGSCAKEDPVLIIMEYLPHGNLQAYLRKSRPSHPGSMKYRTLSTRSLNAKDLTQFAWQVARGMMHLTSCNIIHRDLAARNILIGENRVCKIADFGLARNVEENNVYERTSTGPLPIRWMAPETFHQAYYTTKSDVWSYGVLLWEIVTLGASPYPGQTGEQVMNSVLQGKIMTRPLHCTDDLYRIMKMCWSIKPVGRPSFSDIVRVMEKLLESNEDYIELKDYNESEYMAISPSSNERY